MSNTEVEAKTLLMPMMDFPSEFEDESNRWLDGDHVPERLSCDGVLSCQRFQLTDIEPIGWTPDLHWMKYLTIFTIESLEVLTSPAYELQRNMNAGRGSSWRQARVAQHASRGLKSPSRSLRSVWTQRPSAWKSSLGIDTRSPRSVLVTFRDLASEQDEAINRYFDETYVPEVLSLPGVLRYERYAAAEPRGPRYMDIVDLASPEVATSPLYRLFQSRPSDAMKDFSQSITVNGFGVYLQRPSPWLVNIPSV
jgi:hypothetical protein